MAGKEAVQPEQLGFWRRNADRIVVAGNVVDVLVIGVGVIAANAPAVALGILGLMAGSYVRENVIKRKPTEHTIFKAKTA